MHDYSLLKMYFVTPVNVLRHTGWPTAALQGMSVGPGGTQWHSFLSPTLIRFVPQENSYSANTWSLENGGTRESAKGECQRGVLGEVT